MLKLIVAVVIVGGVAYAWHEGLIGKWLGSAAVSGSDAVKRTQRDATAVKPIEPDAPAEKK